MDGLAAGIAGFPMAPLNVVLRFGAFAAAALLLFPDKGFLVGELAIALSDLAGLVLLALIAWVNVASQRTTDAVTQPPSAPDPEAE